MKKIALLPGGFKPPHAGHYNMAKWLAKNTDADVVVVKVGAKERDGVTREMSLQLWNLYKDSDPDPLSKKLLIQPSTSNSPVRDVYDFVEDTAPEGSTIYLGMGEKDINDARFKNIGKFAEPRGITFQTTLVPPQAGGVSGTEMRGFIKNQQDTFFYNALPDHMSTMDKEDAWAIVIPSLDEMVNEHDIICDECGWTWAIADGGNDLYICHSCGHDNTPNKNLKEVGDGSSKSYPFEQYRDNKDEKIYGFTTTSGEAYSVLFDYKDIWDMWEVGFDIVGGTGKAVVNKGEMYSVMSTISKITFDFIKKIDPKTLLYSASKNFDNDNRRAKLYLAYIKKLLPKWKVGEKSAYVSLTNPKYTPNKMNESALSKKWWKNQLNEILNETKANTHLTHLEELILTQGQDGYNQAKSFLYELIKNLKGEDNSIKNVSVKWDGAPALFTGINPDNGKFFVGTKSVFNKNPKINYTSQDIDVNHGHAPGLAKKLKLALQYLPPVGIKGILQGDFMFDNNDIETSNIDDVSHYTFKPNTIRYAVEANSELGKQILGAKIGIIFHTTYRDLSGGGASFGADVSGLNKTSDVWFDDAYFKDDTGILLSDEEEQAILSKIQEADSIKVNYNSLPNEISSNAKVNLLNTYLNSEVRKGEFIEDPNRSFEMFKEWYQAKIEKAVAKISPKNQDAKRKQFEDKLRTFESKKDIVINLFKVSKLLSEAKNIFIAKYDKAVATKHFIDNGDGTLSVTKAEGFVAVDHTESGIKLVDRLEFSKNNFNAGKPGAKN